MLTVLGLDPGSRSIGFALLQGDRKKFEIRESGALKFDHIKDFMPRLKQIFLSMQKLRAKLSPDEISVESLIFSKNPSSLFKLAQARGAILAAFLEQHEDTKIFEYSPNLIKATTTGYGHSGKKNTMKGLDLIFGPRVYKTHDESDAVAIALCHLFLRPKG